MLALLVIYTFVTNVPSVHAAVLRFRKALFAGIARRMGRA